MKYKCKYYSGGGTEYDGGVWEKKETAKTITLECVLKSFYETNWNKLVIAKDPQKNRHPYSDWGDGTFTIYPDQCGTPHVFEPLE
jgi:hypothetical protein